MTFDPVLHRRLEGTTFDTNRLVGVAARAFILTMYAESGARLSLLPRVQRELRGVTGQPRVRVFRRAIRRRRAAGHYISDEAEVAAANNFAVRLGSILLEEIGRHEELVRLIEPSAKERADAKRLARQLPDSCFRGRGAQADRRIVAEAVVHGLSGVATADVKSIDHSQLNRWLGATVSLSGHRKTRVADTNAALRHVCGREAGVRTVFWWAAAAALPDKACDDDGTVRRFGDRLAAGGFDYAAQQVRLGLARGYGNTRFYGDVRETRSDIPRRIEETRQEMERAAAADICLGW